MKNQIKIAAPLMMRLIDHHPDRMQDLEYRGFISLAELYQDIRHNLLHLLNTRSASIILEKNLTQLNESLLNYGLSDFAQFSLHTESFRQALCLEVKQLIFSFEKRLSEVRVFCVEEDHVTFDAIHLVIEGAICLCQQKTSIGLEYSIDPVQKKFKNVE